MTKIHQMSIDCEQIKFIPSVPLINSPIKILTVARLVEKKGINYGIRVVADMLSRGYRNVEYLIVGDGPLKQNLQRFITEAKYQDNIKMLGWKSQEEII